MSTPRPELRIGDRERDLVASVLQDALAEGRITLEELDARLDGTLAARTYTDLDALVADLPVEPPSSALTSPRAGVDARLSTAPGTSPDDPLVLDAGWSSATRSGRWDVPPFLLLNGALGTVKLDCLEATPLAPVVDVEISGGIGHVTIVLPDDWAANADRVSNAWGMSSVKVGSRPGAGAPLLLLHGSVGWGWLTVRHANRFDRRRVEKRALGRDERPGLTR